MQTHEDGDALKAHDLIDRLKHRAEMAELRGDGQITMGTDGEKPIRQMNFDGMSVVQRPDDQDGILRISIGGGDHLPIEADYCVFRGDPTAICVLLKRALRAVTRMM